MTIFDPLPSRLYCRYWNFTNSYAAAFADFTAGRESHPALKIRYLLVVSIAYRCLLVKVVNVCYNEENQEPDGSLDRATSACIAPSAAVLVMSPPMI